MQLIIEFSKGNLKTNEKRDLLVLLEKLITQNYRIDSIKGKFKKDSSIENYLDSIKNDIALGIIDTDKKYILFDNKYFIAVCYFCTFQIGKNMRPLKVEDVLKEFDGLIINSDKKLLFSLYKMRYLEYQNWLKTNNK